MKHYFWVCEDLSNSSQDKIGKHYIWIFTLKKDALKLYYHHARINRSKHLKISILGKPKKFDLKEIEKYKLCSLKCDGAYMYRFIC